MDLSSVPDLSRRQLLSLLGSSAGAVAGGSYILNDAPAAATQRLDDEDESRQLAEAYAPTLYFGEGERWFPTDPRPYASEQDGDIVVTGFDALDGYSTDMRDAEAPPNPMTFYQVLEYPDSPLVCVQYWFYSVFDQFTTNFHWHDWEVLHVYVDRSMSVAGATESAGSSATATDTASDTETATKGDSNPGVPALFVASAHSHNVPNNEYLDPPNKPAAIISEVGSHPSTLGVNAEPSTFQRTSLGELAADISNDPVEIIAAQSSLPLAYGLPRDEGLKLPYAIPELEGEPLPDHDKLPNLRASDLLPDKLTAESFDALARPPDNIPYRTGDYSFVPAANADSEGDVQYELVHIDKVQSIDGFTGPTLSFSFRVPEFAEDAFSKHLSTPGAPWAQDRFTNPTADISDPQHRAALANRYGPITEGGSTSRILGAVREATGSDDAPGSNGVSLLVPSIETVALLESEPVAVPSFSSVIAIKNPPAGEHRFTVNGAGMAPYSQALSVDGESDTRVGVAGEVPMAANEDAVKVQGETADGAALDALTIDDDFEGTLYDAKPPGTEGRFGIYAHRDGAYTTEVRDENENRGARRVNPNADDERVGLEKIQTGKASLADYLVRFLTETREQASVFEDGTPDGIDDVPTGQDVTDEVINETASAAKENADDIVENVGKELDDGLGSDQDTETDRTENETVTATTEPIISTDTENAIGTENATETKTPTNTETATDTSANTSLEPAGTGFSGLLKSIDASLLVAVAARKNARSGKTVQADKRLKTLRKRLLVVQNAVEKSEGLPDKLGPLAKNRVEQMLPRVQAALNSDQ